MFCPKCDTGKTMVLDTRSEGELTYRRRKCKECGYRFYTKEAETYDGDCMNEYHNYHHMKWLKRSKQTDKCEKNQ